MRPCSHVVRCPLRPFVKVTLSQRGNEEGCTERAPKRLLSAPRPRPTEGIGRPPSRPVLCSSPGLGARGACARALDASEVIESSFLLRSSPRASNTRLPAFHNGPAHSSTGGEGRFPRSHSSWSSESRPGRGRPGSAASRTSTHPPVRGSFLQVPLEK